MINDNESNRPLSGEDLNQWLNRCRPAGVPELTISVAWRFNGEEFEPIRPACGWQLHTFSGPDGEIGVWVRDDGATFCLTPAGERYTLVGEDLIKIPGWVEVTPLVAAC